MCAASRGRSGGRRPVGFLSVSSVHFSVAVTNVSTGNCSFIVTWLSGVRKRNFRVFVRSCFTDASSYISTDCMEHCRRRNK